MKTFYTSIILALCAMISKGEAEEKMNQQNYNYGSQRYGKETLNTIQANGILILEGTKVLGPVLVNGSLEADGAVMDSLRVNGQADLIRCEINAGSVINGTINAEDTKFHQELAVASQRVTLRGCRLDALTLRKMTGFDGIQVIDLRSGTKVTGPIVVESGNGEIWISSNSEITDQISGATVHKK